MDTTTIQSLSEEFVLEANAYFYSLGCEPPCRDIPKWEHLRRVFAGESGNFKNVITPQEVLLWAEAFVERQLIKSRIARDAQSKNARRKT